MQSIKTLAATLLVAALCQGAGATSPLLPPLPPLPVPETEIVGAETVPPAVVALPDAPTAPRETTNRITAVFLPDFLTLEMRLAEPLSEEELDPRAIDLARERFIFSGDVLVLSAPVPVEGERNLYRLRVDGLEPSTLYMVRYRDSEEQSFKTYANAREMAEHYKGRYGNSW